MPGAERQHEHDAGAARAGAEAHLGQPGGVGVVDDVDVAARRLGEQGVDVGADPRVVEVGRAQRHAVADDAGERRRRHGPPCSKWSTSRHDDVGHRLRRRRLRGRDLEAVVEQRRRWPGRRARPSSRIRRCRSRRLDQSRRGTVAGPIDGGRAPAANDSVWRSTSASVWWRREERHVVERRQQHAPVEGVEVQVRLQLLVAGGGGLGAGPRRRAEPVLGPAAEPLHRPRPARGRSTAVATPAVNRCGQRDGDARSPRPAGRSTSAARMAATERALPASVPPMPLTSIDGSSNVGPQPVAPGRGQAVGGGRDATADRLADRRAGRDRGRRRRCTRPDRRRSCGSRR